MGNDDSGGKICKVPRGKQGKESAAPVRMTQ